MSNQGTVIHRTSSRRVEELLVTTPAGHIKILVDPATVEAIVSAASFLFDLFKGDPNAELGSWMQSVSDQLYVINSKLDTVLAALAQLGVAIQQDQAAEKERDILGAIDSYKQNLALWMSAPSQYQLDMTTKLGVLQDGLNAYRRNSYANFATVAYGLRVLLDYLDLTKRTAVKKPVIKDYLSYFESCIAPDVSGSVEQARTASETAATQNAAEESRFVINTWTYTGRIQWDIDDRCYCYCEFWTMFSYDAASDSYIAHPDFRNQGERCRGGHGPGNIELVAFGSPNPPPDASQPCIAQMYQSVAHMNNVHRAKLEALARQSALQTAKDAITKLIAELEKMMPGVSVSTLRRTQDAAATAGD